MTSYFDTSILLPVIYGDHELHETALALIRDNASKGTIATTTLHTFAELYTGLTKPGKGRPNMDLAATRKVLIESVSQQMTLVELDMQDYQKAIDRCVDLNLTGAVIYDALHYQAALKIKADILYTDNLRDFNRLWREEDGLEISGVR